MIYRKNQKSDASKDTPLQRLRNRIEGEPAMNLSILDLSQDDDTLIVLCSENHMITLIRMALEKHWPGNMEVYCVLDMITGSTPSPNNEAIDWEYAKSARYLN